MSRKSGISAEQLRRFDALYHGLIRLLQSSSAGSFKGGLLEGVGTIEMSVLTMAREVPDLILKDVVARLNVAGSTLTSAVDRLEKRGFLRRTISRRDRRSYGLALTETGARACEEHLEREQTIFREVLGSFDTATERTVFMDLLQKMLARFDTGSPRREER